MEPKVLNVVLFQPEIPYNTGAVGRTCVGLGAKLWLVRPLGFQLDDRHMKRAGLDYWPFLDWEVVDDWECLTQKLPQTDRYFFFTKKAKRSYWIPQYQRGDVLVFGSETNGIPDFFQERYEPQCVRIPIHANARCLNLSVSVGVGTFEAVRQIRAAENQLEALE